MDRSNDRTSEASAQGSQQMCPQETSDQLAMPEKFSAVAASELIEPSVAWWGTFFKLEVPAGIEYGARLIINEMKDTSAIPNDLRVEIEPKQDLTTNRLTIHLGSPPSLTVEDKLEKDLEKIFSFSEVIARRLGIESATLKSKLSGIMTLDGKLPDKVAACQSIATKRPDYVL